MTKFIFFRLSSTRTSSHFLFVYPQFIHILWINSILLRMQRTPCLHCNVFYSIKKEFNLFFSFFYSFFLFCRKPWEFSTEDQQGSTIFSEGRSKKGFQDSSGGIFSELFPFIHNFFHNLCRVCTILHTGRAILCRKNRPIWSTPPLTLWKNGVRGFHKHCL